MGGGDGGSALPMKLHSSPGKSPAFRLRLIEIVDSDDDSKQSRWTRLSVYFQKALHPSELDGFWECGDVRRNLMFQIIFFPMKSIRLK